MTPNYRTLHQRFN